MKYEEAKEQFIQAWGTLGSSWGVNRTMAQIHALLMVSTAPLSADDVMEELKISRGNANMNIRALIDWGLAKKVLKPGERKEFFVTDKEVWRVAQQVARERKKRELEPILGLFQELKNIEGEGEDVEEFKRISGELSSFASTAESFIDLFVASKKKSWLFNVLAKLKL